MPDWSNLDLDKYNEHIIIPWRPGSHCVSLHYMTWVGSRQIAGSSRGERSLVVISLHSQCSSSHILHLNWTVDNSTYWCSRHHQQNISADNSAIFKEQFREQICLKDPQFEIISLMIIKV